MVIWGKRPEPRSWNGETAGEQKERSNDAPNNPCKNGHAWGFTRYTFHTENGKEVRYAVYGCLRGCTATKEERA